MHINTQIVGIVNVTPDSFSDGGTYAEAEAAYQHAARMVKEGAVVIDIGAESTRPGAAAVQPEEEWARLEPVLELLKAQPLAAAISVDTRHAATAQKALALGGVDWINDVSGGADPALVEVVKNSEAQLVVMHSLSVPAEKERVLPAEVDVVEEIVAWAKARLEALEAAGITRERIIIDPGIGFGKTAEQSRTLIEGIAALTALGVPVLVGHSRKSFLTLYTDDMELEARDAATHALSKDLAAHGVAYIRVHDVAGNVAALREEAA